MQGAKKITLAIPVGPKETIEEFKELVDEVICLYIPEEFYAVGSACFRKIHTKINR